MKKLLMYSLLLALVFGVTNSFAQSGKKAVIISGEKATSKRSGDYVIPTADVPKPATPSSARGATCCVSFENYTGYYIDIWVDNVYKGRLAPYDSGSVCVDNGYKSVYAETIGGTYYWSKSGSCYDDWVILNLKP